MDRRRTAWAVGIAIGALVLLWIIWPSPRESTGHPRGSEFPPELAEAIRDGIALTREARRDAIDGIASANRWRLLSIVIGASIPIVAAYLALRLAATKDPDEADVMALMIKESNIIAKRALRDIERRKLKDSKSLSKGKAGAEDPQDSPADETPDDE